MKKKKKRMPLFQKIFYIISFVFLITSFIFLGTRDFSTPKKNLSDSESFAEEYKISSNNLFVYKSSKEILDILSSGNGIIFMGYPENSWSKKIASLLNESASQNAIEEIYYYNFKKDRSNNTKNYQEIAKVLKKYLLVVENDSPQLYAPIVFVVKNGEILFYDDETSFVRGEDKFENYWTSEKCSDKINQYNTAFKKYLGAFF